MSDMPEKGDPSVSESDADWGFETPVYGSALASDQPVAKDAAVLDGMCHPSNDPAVEGEAGSAKFLLGLTKWHPFIGFFLFLSDCLYPDSMAPHERVGAMRASHRKLYWSMVFGDVLVLVGVLVLLGYVSWRVALKTLG